MNYRFYRYFSVGLRHHSNMSQHVTSKLPQPWYSYHVRCSPSMSQWSESSGPKTRVLSLTVQLWEGANGDACQGDGHPSMYGQTVGPILKQDNLCDSCSAETLENQWVSWRLILGFPFKKMNRIFTHCYRLFACPNVWWLKKPDLLCLQHGFGSFLGFLVLPEFGREEQATQAGVEIESYMEAM